MVGCLWRKGGRGSMRVEEEEEEEEEEVEWYGLEYVEFWGSGAGKRKSWQSVS